MLGLSIDKLLVVAIVAALIIGPQRLPGYAQRLGEIVRGLRSFLDAARARAEAETGLTKEDWVSMDPRQYDPRRIVREALAEPAVDAATAAPARTEAEADAPDAAQPARRYIVTGSSAHPRRVPAFASAAPAPPAHETMPDERSASPVGGSPA